VTRATLVNMNRGTATPLVARFSRAAVSDLRARVLEPQGSAQGRAHRVWFQLECVAVEGNRYPKQADPRY
jgi:hypothetical protein